MLIMCKYSTIVQSSLFIVHMVAQGTAHKKYDDEAAIKGERQSTVSQIVRKIPLLILVRSKSFQERYR